jgi:hypothetical protein
MPWQEPNDEMAPGWHGNCESPYRRCSRQSQFLRKQPVTKDRGVGNG